MLENAGYSTPASIRLVQLYRRCSLLSTFPFAVISSPPQSPAFLLLHLCSTLSKGLRKETPGRGGRKIINDPSHVYAITMIPEISSRIRLKGSRFLHSFFLQTRPHDHDEPVASICFGGAVEKRRRAWEGAWLKAFAWRDGWGKLKG